MNETVLPEWDYPDNNYTYYGKGTFPPPGVQPRYLFIQEEGRAFLLNGLPERSNVNADSDTFMVPTLYFLGVLGILLHGYQFKVVWMKPKLSKAVRAFLLFESYFGLNTAVMNIFGATCVLTWFCVDGRGYPYNWLFVSIAWVTYDQGLNQTAELNILWMSINRFFAVYFNGRYYRYVEKIGIPLIFVTWIVYGALFLHTIGTGYDRGLHVRFFAGFYWHPLLYTCYSIWYRNRFTFWLPNNVHLIALGYLGLTAIFDMAAYWKIRSVRKNAPSSNQQNHADFKLLVMIIITHLIHGTLLISFQLLFIWPWATPWLSDLFLNVLPEIFRLCMSLVVIHFMRTPRASTRRSDKQETKATVVASTTNTKDQ